jgi:hypothetical protein
MAAYRIANSSWEPGARATSLVAPAKAAYHGGLHEHGWAVDASPSKLCIARETFLQSWHADQYQTNFLGIENCAHLLQTRHPQAVGLIDHDEGRRIADAAFLFSILPCDLTISWLRPWNWPGQLVAGMKCLLGVLLVAPATKAYWPGIKSSRANLRFCPR